MIKLFIKTIKNNKKFQKEIKAKACLNFIEKELQEEFSLSLQVKPLVISIFFRFLIPLRSIRNDWRSQRAGREESGGFAAAFFSITSS